jgi:hypothetical protein
MSDYTQAAQAACDVACIVFQNFPADGSWHVTDATDKPPRNGNGRIKPFADGTGGMVQNWGTMDKPEPFFIDSGVKLDPAELAERNRRIKAERDQAAAELAESRKKAAITAKAVVSASQTPADNPYLLRKQVEPTTTIREIMLEALAKIISYHPQAKGKPFATGKILIIPVRNHQGMTTIEMIDCNGLKAGLKDGMKKGGFWSTGKLPDGDGSGLTVGIGEGVATMLTYNQATGYTGIAALSCGNLKAVAEYFRDRYPAARIEIVSDVGNGEQAATEAAREVKGYLAKPTFPEGSTGSDINDLFVESGLQAVKDCIQAAAPPAIIAGIPVIESDGEQPPDNEDTPVDDFQERAEPAKKQPLPKIKTMADLLTTTFAAIRWVIFGLLPEGLAILSGPPKIGKSWMVMNLCLAVSLGGYVFGKFKVEIGEVLLLSLEDNERRLKGRLLKCLGDIVAALTNFHAVTSWKRLDQGGLDDLASWLEQHPDCKLVVIDTMQKIKAHPKRKNGNAYENDYDSYGDMQRLALLHRCCILVIHHNRKSDSKNDGDPLEQISGSTGVTGSMDTILMLRRPRGAAGAVLTATGRDISEAEYAMNFDGTLGQWIVTGQAAEISMKEGSQASTILSFMKDNAGNVLAAQDIYEGLDEKIKFETVKRELGRLSEKNIIQRDKGKFAYFAPISTVSLVPNLSTHRDTKDTKDALVPKDTKDMYMYMSGFIETAEIISLDDSDFEGAIL